MDFQDFDFYAEMNDYSQGGLSMMSDEKLILRQLIYFEMKNHDSNSKGPETNKGIGTVRWIKAFQPTNSGANPMYKYGVEFSNSN